jgi:hypothetical protein
LPAGTPYRIGRIEPPPCGCRSKTKIPTTPRRTTPKDWRDASRRPLAEPPCCRISDMLAHLLPYASIRRKVRRQVSHGSLRNFGGLGDGHTKQSKPIAPHTMTGSRNCQPASISTTLATHEALSDCPLPITRECEKNTRATIHAATDPQTNTNPNRRRREMLINVLPPNDAHHWRRPTDVQSETDAESRRPVNEPGSMPLSSAAKPGEVSGAVELHGCLWPVC